MFTSEEEGKGEYSGDGGVILKGGGGDDPHLKSAGLDLFYGFAFPGIRARGIDGDRELSAGLGFDQLLEFLGDRVLGLVVAEILYRCFPFENEGALARRHSALVCTETLAKIARDLDVPDLVKLSKSENFLLTKK